MTDTLSALHAPATGSPDLPAWDAIIVAGGRASRLGGIDKTALRYEGRTLLGRSLDAARSASHIAVIGHDGHLNGRQHIQQATEEPRWGGPAAAIAAGLASLRQSDSEFTAVFAGDQPHIGEAIAQLCAELPTEQQWGEASDGVIAEDESGHAQPLLAIYRTAALRAAVSRHRRLDGLSVRRLIEPLVLRAVPLPGELCADVDTPADAHELGIALPESPEASR